MSFISLTKVLLPVRIFLRRTARLYASLSRSLKPAGKVGKHGVVKDKTVHEEVIRKTADYACSIGFSPEGLTIPLLKGLKKYQYLLYLKKGSGSFLSDETVKGYRAAHEELD